MRLDQFLSARTMDSRLELRQKILAGRITVDGTVMLRADQAVHPDTQTICLDGAVVPGDTYLYVLLHKPKGYVCSANEPGQHSVLELVPPSLSRKALQPVGRLDKDSTGMLLLTDDGQLSHQITASRSHAEKYYIVVLARPWEPYYAERFAQGITLSDGEQCLPARAVFIPGTDNQVLVCLHEGKYHQVRRMMAALGNHVSDLCRVAIGGLTLPPDLACGDCQLLYDEDVQKILKNKAILQACYKSFGKVRHN